MRLRHNSAQDSIENTICVFFMRLAGARLRPVRAVAADKAAITMNSMAHATFRIYIPSS
jgi:hypothetical protein